MKLRCPHCGGVLSGRAGDSFVKMVMRHIDVMHPEQKAKTKSDMLAGLGSAFRLEEE